MTIYTKSQYTFYRNGQADSKNMQKCKGPRQPKQFLKRTLRPLVIWQWLKDKYINEAELNTEIDPQTCSQLFLTKVSRQLEERKMFKKW